MDPSHFTPWQPSPWRWVPRWRRWGRRGVRRNLWWSQRVIIIIISNWATFKERSQVSPEWKLIIARVELCFIPVILRLDKSMCLMSFFFLSITRDVDYTVNICSIIPSCMNCCLLFCSLLYVYNNLSFLPEFFLSEI